MAVKQVFLPVGMIHTREELLFAQHHPETRQRLDERRGRLDQEIAVSERELDDLLCQGFQIVSSGQYSDSRLTYFHYLLWKNGGDDEPDHHQPQPA